ncbi:MAG: ATP-binding cassette domain-containing protein [Lautropia sp.]
MARIEAQGLADAPTRRPKRREDYTLQPLDLVLRDGGAHALLGAADSGAGRLFELLSGQRRPSHGQVLFDGRDVTALPPWARNVALVSRRPAVYPAMTVAENLAFPLRNRGVAAAAVRSRVDRIAELLLLADELARPAGRLADELRLRVALGRALVVDDVAAVLLDDPLAAAEPARRPALRLLLRTVRRALGRTWLLVTSDADDALTFADEVAVLIGGRVVQVGTAAALFDEPVHAGVGRAIGRPGMNFLPVTAGDGEPCFAGRTLIEPAPAQLAAWLSAQRAAVPNAGLTLGIRPEHLTLAEAGAPGAIAAELRQLQECGTTLLLSARIGSADVAARIAADSPAALDLAAAAGRPQPASQMLRLSLINRHTRFYRDEELLR